MIPVWLAIITSVLTGVTPLAILLGHISTRDKRMAKVRAAWLAERMHKAETDPSPLRGLDRAAWEKEIGDEIPRDVINDLKRRPYRRDRGDLA
jgi:hypothetical protein